MFLIVADGLGDKVTDGIKIIDVGLRQVSRFKRVTIDSKKSFKKAVALNCDIYHFHDPELVRVGLLLKRQGKKVIYDVHEDLPRQIFGKPYLKNYIKPFLSKLIEWQENNAAKKFSFVCAATPTIRDRFISINKNSIDVNNYPIIETNQKTNWVNKFNEVCYIGAISDYRGVFELIKSIDNTNVRLNLAGDFEDVTFEQRCKNHLAWKNVNYFGYVDRSEINNILKRSKIGLVTLKPLVNYLEALPIKMFEYMAAGIPVIASNFPLWKEIVEGNNCGNCVDPTRPKEIAKAINCLINNPEKAEQMGKNGKKAVFEKYNWKSEEKKLLAVYKKVLRND